MAGANDNAARIARSAALTLVISVAVLYLGDRFGIEFIDDLIRGGVQYWASTPGVFAAEEHSGFTVVDNNTGDCFTETFATLTGALAYIDGAEAEDAHRIDLAPLPLDLITFGDEISECEDRLNFYIPVTFDCDAVFGTNVCSIDNDDCPVPSGSPISTLAAGST